MLTLLKITVCLMNTGSWGSQETEYLCCELIVVNCDLCFDLLLYHRQVISPFSNTVFFFSDSSVSSDYAEYPSQHFSWCEWLVLSPLQTWSWLLCQKSSLTHRNLSHSESSSRPVLESMQRDACLERNSPGAWHPWLGSLLQGQGHCTWCTWVLSLSHR